MPLYDSDEYLDTLNKIDASIDDFGGPEYVIYGDFNVSLNFCNSINARNLKAFIARRGLVNSMTDSNVVMPNYTFHRHGSKRSLIDYCFVSSDLYNNVSQSFIIDEHPLNVSDHLPGLIRATCRGLYQYTSHLSHKKSLVARCDK